MGIITHIASVMCKYRNDTIFYKYINIEGYIECGVLWSIVWLLCLGVWN